MPRDASSASDDQWATGEPALAAFAEDLRTVASGPAPAPGPGLLAAMSRGSVVPTGPQPGRPKMLVKTVLGSLAAKVALGVGVAAASVGAVGATGVLPDQAQHAVASVVSATTPFVLPDPSTERPQVAADVPTSATSTTLAGGAGDDSTTEGSTTGERADNHGACVSAVAQDKSGTDSHGKTVSSVARSDCGKATTSSTVPVTSTTSSTSSTSSTSTSSTSTTVAGANPSANSGPGSASSGKGNNNSSNGNGNGNGNGNSNTNGGKGSSSENSDGGGSGSGGKG